MSYKVFEDYRKITKPLARRMYSQGYDIKMLPCSVSCSILTGTPHDYDWLQPVTININTCEYDMNKFDRSVSDFEYHNCNAELGYYAHYFVATDDYFNYKKLLRNNKISEKEEN